MPALTQSIETQNQIPRAYIKISRLKVQLKTFIRLNESKDTIFKRLSDIKGFLSFDPEAASAVKDPVFIFFNLFFRRFYFRTTDAFFFL